MITENITRKIMVSSNDERNELHKVYGGSIYISDFDTYHPSGEIGKRIQVDMKRFTKNYRTYKRGI